MEAHKTIEYKNPIIKALQELGGTGTADQIYDIVIKKYINLNDEDLKKVEHKGKIIDYTFSRYYHSWALAQLQKENTIQKIKPETYQLLI